MDIQVWCLVVVLLCLVGIFKAIFDWARNAGKNQEFEDTEFPNEEDE